MINVADMVKLKDSQGNYYYISDQLSKNGLHTLYDALGQPKTKINLQTALQFGKYKIA
jgi:hypothetical protein